MKPLGATRFNFLIILLLLTSLILRAENSVPCFAEDEIEIEGSEDYPITQEEALRYSTMLVEEELRSKKLEIAVELAPIQANLDGFVYLFQATANSGRKITVGWDIYVQAKLCWDKPCPN